VHRPELLPDDDGFLKAKCIAMLIPHRSPHYPAQQEPRTRTCRFIVLTCVRRIAPYVRADQLIVLGRRQYPGDDGGGDGADTRKNGLKVVQGFLRRFSPRAGRPDAGRITRPRPSPRSSFDLTGRARRCGKGIPGRSSSRTVPSPRHRRRRPRNSLRNHVPCGQHRAE